MKIARSGSFGSKIVISEEPPRDALRPCANIMYESLMDSKYDNIDIKAQQKKILQSLANALEDHHYTNSITVGTGDRRNVYANFEYSRKVLEECLG